MPVGESYLDSNVVRTDERRERIAAQHNYETSDSDSHSHSSNDYDVSPGRGGGGRSTLTAENLARRDEQELAKVVLRDNIV